MRDCSIVSPAALLLFGTSLQVQHVDAQSTVNGWVKVRCPAQTAVLLQRVREALDWLLQRRLEGSEDAREQALIECVVQVFGQEELYARDKT